jgi:hypothetical protein
MSAPVATAALADRIEELGPVAYLVTVGPEGAPHVVAVEVGWDGDRLVVGAGRHTSANASARPTVSLVWAAPPGAGYCLIVDGEARAHAGTPPAALVVEPTRAVLHRTPEGDPTSPSCITLLPAP